MWCWSATGRGAEARDDPSRLLNLESLARLEEFQQNVEDARQLFRSARQRFPNLTSRFLREWAAFEKRQGDLEVRFPPSCLPPSLPLPLLPRL